MLNFLTLTLIIAAGWTTGKDVLYKNKPNINIEDKLFLSRSNLTLDKQSFPFAVVLQDDRNIAFYTPTYFDYEVLHTKIFNVDGTSNTTSYELETCQKHHFPNL